VLVKQRDHLAAESALRLRRRSCRHTATMRVLVSECLAARASNQGRSKVRSVGIGPWKGCRTP
jgi:hypothetical protein